MGKFLNGIHVSGTTQLDFMPTHESEGIITLGRYDANTSRYHNIKSYVSSTLASNYLKFSLHNGTANTVVDVITLKGDKSTTFAGDVTLANGNSLRWTSDDVRIEATTASDNMKFYVGASEILKLEQSGTLATITGNLTVTGSTTMAGINPTSTTTPLIQLQGDLDILNKAQTAYLDFATRDTTGSEVVYNLSNVGAATFAGNVTATYFGRDAHNRIDFQTDDVIHYRVADSYIYRMDGNGFRPYTDSTHDLGGSSYYWKHAYIDTITTTGDVNITQTADVGVLNTTNLDDGSAVGLSITYPTSNVAAGDGLAIAIGIAGRGRSYIANSNVTNNLDASNLIFYTEGGGTIVEALKIDTNQNITIGAGKKLYLDGSDNTYIYESGDGVIDFYGDNTHLVSMKQNGTQSEVVVNEGSGDVDFRVESNNSTHALFVEAEGAGKVGIGESDPEVKLEVAGDIMAKDSFASVGLGATDGYIFHDFGTGWGYKGMSGGIGSRLAMYTGGNEVFSIDGNGDAIFGRHVTIEGNLIVDGLTTTINSQTVSVDDKNIELGAVVDQAGQTATLGVGTAVVTVASTSGYLPGATLTKTSGSGAFNSGGATITSVDSATQFTASANHDTAGAITFTVGGDTDLTADGGGITLKGTTDKTITWTNSTDSWDFNQNIKTSGNITVSSSTNRSIILDATQGSGGYSWMSFKQSGAEQFRVFGAYGSDYLSFYNDQNSVGHQLTLAADGKVGIGTVGPAALLEIAGSGDALRIESTNTGAAGAQIDLLHFTTSPADNDVNALINFGGYYTGTTSAYANQIKSVWTDVSARDAELQFWTNNAGTLTKALTLDTGQNATFVGTVSATNFTIGGAQGSDGQVLTSTGSGVAWEAATSTDNTKLPLAGGTITGHVLFNDGIELRLGADTDMGLFSSSGTSHIRVNEGIFALRANDLRLMNQANNESYIRATSNAGVLLYYDNSNVLETVAIGSQTKFDGGGAAIGHTIHNEGTAAGDDAKIAFETQAAMDWAIGIDRSDSNKFKLSQSENLGTNDRLEITSAGVATFAGNVISKDTFYLENGSGNRWQMLFDTNAFNLRYYNGSSWSADAFAIDTSNNATFAGAVTASGNITTDGIFINDSAPDNNVFEAIQSGRKMALYTYFSSNANDSEWRFRTSTGATNGATTDALIVKPGSATFAGDVSAQGFTIDGATLQSFQDFQSKTIDTDSGLFTVGGHGMAVGYSRAISLWSASDGTYRSWVGTNLRWDGTNYKRASNHGNNNWGNIAGLLFLGDNTATGTAIKFIIDPPENASGSGEATIGTSLPSGYTALSINNDLSATFGGDIALGDGKKLQFGAGPDFEIWHAAGENTYLVETGEGATVFKSTDWYFQDTSANTALHLSAAGNATFTGTITATTNGSAFGNISVDRINLGDNEKIIWGGGSDLQIYHQSSDNTTYIFANNTNPLKIATETSGTPITIGHGTSMVTIGDNLTVVGDLEVTGETTTTNVVNLDVSDNIIGLNRGSTSNANDSGLIIERGSTGDNAAFLWDESADRFIFGTTTANPAATGNITVAKVPIEVDSIFLPNNRDIGWDGGYSASKPTLAAVGTTMKMFPSGATSGAQFELTPTTATFAGAVSLTGGALSISGDGSNAATLTETSAGILTIATVDDFVVDAGGDITLDADGGDIRLKDAGNTFGFFNSTSDHFYIGAGTQDKDIIFQGNDGGSQINVLTLDMSAAGSAFFNHDIVLVDNGKVTFGGGSDLQIYHDGSNNYIHSTTSDQDINILGNDGGSTITALTFDMSAAGAATFNSTIATSDVYGASSLRLAALGGTAYLDATASVILRTNGTTTALTLDTSQNATFAGTITTSAGTSSIYNRLKIWDNTNQINIGQWDGANHRMEFDANRPVLITSYQGNINLGISGGTTLNVHSSGIVVTGQTKSTTGWFTDNVYLSGGQLYIGASGANATTDDSHRLRSVSGAFYIDARESGTWAADFTIDTSGNITGAGEISASDDMNTPTKLVVGESATAEVRIKKTAAGDGKLSFYTDGNNQTAYINHDAAENLYYYLPSGKTHIFYGSGSERLHIGGDVSVVGSTDFAIPQGRKLLLDGVGGHTYLEEVSDSNLKFYVAGVEMLNMTNDHLYIPDSKNIIMGAGNDLRLYHNATDSHIDNYTGNLNIVNNTDNGNINFYCDDGSGGVALYFYLDGNNALNRFSKHVRLADSVQLQIGAAADFNLYHNGTVSQIENYTGAFNIQQHQNDGNMVFASDDGNGGIFDYFSLDGGSTTHDGSATTAAYTKWQDKSRIALGTGKDLQLFHDGSNSYIENGTGALKIGCGTISFSTDSTYLSNYVYTFRDAVGINNPNSTSAATSSTTVMAIGAKSGGTVNTSLITTGAVGIGTASPSSDLHVQGAPANGVYLAYLYNSGTHNSSHGLNVQTAATNIAAYGLRVNTGGDSNALAVMGTGDVGIGTATPYAKLDVVNGTNNNEAADATDFRFVAANRAITTERANMEIYTNNAQAADLGGSIGFGGRHTDSSTNDSLFATIKAGKSNATTGNYLGYLEIGTSDAASDITQRLKIDSTGATFAGAVNIGASQKIYLGGSTARMHVYHTGSSGEATVLTKEGHLNLVNQSHGSDIIFKTEKAADGAVVIPLTLDSEGPATFSGNVTIPGAISAGSNGGIRIHSSGTKFFNVTAANAAQDATMDIGASDARFKDLWLSGDITASQLTIDDYIYHAGDTNTYIYFTPDVQTFRTGGGDRLIINQYGLGIGGAASAGYAIEAEGTGHQRFNIRSSDNNTAGLFLQVKNSGNQTGNATLRTDSAGLFTLWTGTTSEAIALSVAADKTATFENSVLIPNKLEHSGDTNTYLSFSANDHIELTAGGTEFLAIDGTTLTLSPSSTFTIDAGGQVNIDSGNSEIHLKGSGTTFGKLYTSGGDFYINHPTSDEDIIIRGNDGGSGVNALTFDMSDGGRATFNNDVVAFSDERLKKNIKTLDGSKVYDMRGVSFTRKDTDKEGSGVIAQEMEKVAPELVTKTNDTLGVSYGNLTGYLIEAIKDLKAEVEELKQCNKCEDCNCKNE